MHLAVLRADCDEVAGSPHGEMVVAGARAAGLDTVTFADFDVTRGQFPSEDDKIDAFLISGSPSSANDEDAWIGALRVFLLDHVVGKRPVVGLCFGHQLLQSVLGGTVQDGVGWELGVCSVTLTDVGRDVFAKETLDVMQTHSDAVVRPAPGFATLASNDAGEFQGLLDAERRAMTLQWHPEFTPAIVTRILETDAVRAAATPALADAGIASLSRPTSRDAMALAIARFLATP